MPESENTMLIRSHGISAEGVRDQYADGKAAKVIIKLISSSFLKNNLI